MTIHWKTVEQYFTVVIFVFLSYRVCNFETFIKFGFGTVRTETVKQLYFEFSGQEGLFLKTFHLYF